MNISRFILGAGFALALPLVSHADSSARTWLEYYYQNPQPDKLPDAVLALSKDGYFE